MPIIGFIGSMSWTSPPRELIQSVHFGPKRKLMKFLSHIALACLICLIWATISSGAAVRSGTVIMDFDLSSHPKGEEAKLWIPYPVSDADQQIFNVRVQGDYAEAAVYTDRVYGNPMLFVRWSKDASSRKLTFAFDAERQEVVRRDFPKKEAPWSPADYALCLAPTSLGPTNGEVKKLADRITKGKKTVLEKTRAIYDWTVENTWRDPDTRGCGTGDVCVLLLKPGGKCADIHSVFIALARAAGVPSREVFGIRLGKKAQEDITGAYHCWAEFYLPGYGWVPADPADVRKALLTEKLELKDPKTAELRAFYWGGIDPYRVKFSVGRDLTLNPPQLGDAVNYLMYPFAQIGGNTLDWLDPANFRYSVGFKEK